MLSTLFAISAVCLFGLLFAYEAAGSASPPKFRPAGLLTWLVSGNWPAKVGAGLLILGIGALLRYALVNLEVPPELKLGSGFVTVAILGVAALALRSRPERRAIYLALSGTAFAVAYLTAYAAYDFFHYVNEINGLALMVIVSAAAGVFAVSSGSMSVAVLAMAGAYIAPKFAINLPGPAVLYGYYLAASAVTFVMVCLRGWRPLIHLSFLFTLAGGLFFAWTNQFYSSAHYPVMQPLLLALAALHLAMPIAEHRGTSSRWLARFDMGYFLVLPLVAAGLTLKIAPSVSREGAIGLGMLALVWSVAAVVLGFLRRYPDATRHAFIAVLLLICAGALAVNDVPWLMVGLTLAVAGLAVAPRLGWSQRTQDLLCGAAMLIGMLHIVFSIVQTVAGQPFVNEVFAQRALSGALMGVGAWFAIRTGLSSGRMLGVMAAVWSCLAVTAELLRLHIDFLPQLVYAVLLVMAAMASFSRRLEHQVSVWGGWLLLAAAACSFWAAHDASFNVVLGFAAGTPLAFLLVASSASGARRTVQTGTTDERVPSVALGLLPLSCAPWVFALVPNFGSPGLSLPMSLLVGLAILVAVAGKLWIPSNSAWYRQIWPMHFGVIGVTLLYLVLFRIERGLLPVILEVLALSYMAIFIGWRRDSAGLAQARVVVIIAAFLVVQAMLLRVFGPDRIMSAADIMQMKLPAAASLLWASCGAGLAWWGSRIKSRGQWGVGVALLALTACKLVFRDFGALDQLGNILALIGAGILFLAVAWFAPIPPAASRVERKVLRDSAPRQEAPDYLPTQPGPLDGGNVATRASEESAITAVDAGSASAPRSASADGSLLAPPPRRPKPASPTGGFNWLMVLAIGLPLALIIIGQQWFVHSRAAPRLTSTQQASEVVSEAAAPAAPAVELPRIATPPAEQARLSVESAAKKPDELPVRSLPPAPVKVADACTTFVDQLPSDYVLFAGGSYGGSPLDFQIDQSGHSATRFDVVVNEPGKKVVLALGAYEPSVWNIRWTAETVLAGVFVSGYHRQAVAGLDSSIPVLNASYDNKSSCGYFYLDRNDVAKTDALMRKLFGRSAQTYFLAPDGRVSFGKPASSPTQYTQSAAQSVDSYRDKNAPLAGQPGIEQLLREGKLRLATQQDVAVWQDAVTRAKNLPQLNIVGASSERSLTHTRFDKAYVVLKPMRFPAGLYGAHSVTFFVAKGVSRPEGNPGHSQVHDMNLFQ